MSAAPPIPEKPVTGQQRESTTLAAQSMGHKAKALQVFEAIIRVAGCEITVPRGLPENLSGHLVVYDDGENVTVRLLQAALGDYHPEPSHPEHLPTTKEVEGFMRWLTGEPKLVEQLDMAVRELRDGEVTYEDIERTLHWLDDRMKANDEMLADIRAEREAEHRALVAKAKGRRKQTRG